MVTANWRKNWPVTPPMNAAGTNTARQHQRDGDDRPGHLVHRLAASPPAAPRRAPASARRSRPPRWRRPPRCRSPAPGRTASGCSARSPAAAMTANVPMMATGTATSGMIVARQFCRNTSTTRATRMHGVPQGVEHLVDRLADERRGVVDDPVVQPSGNRFFSSSILASTPAGGLAGRWPPAGGRWSAPPTAGRPGWPSGRTAARRAGPRRRPSACPARRPPRAGC